MAAVSGVVVAVTVACAPGAPGVWQGSFFSVSQCLGKAGAACANHLQEPDIASSQKPTSVDDMPALKTATRLAVGIGRASGQNRAVFFIACV